MTDEEKTKAVEAALGKPVLPEFPEATSKIRLNLMVVASITIAMVILDVQVASTNTLLGVTFQGITTSNLKTMLLVINVYMFVHFAWCAFDGLQEWRLRVTGTRVAFITGSRMASPHADHPGDPRQSTLYNWWIEQNAQITRFDESAQRLKGEVTAVLDESRKAQPETRPMGPALENALNELYQEISSLTHLSGTVRKVIEAERVPVSLRRFDRAFMFFLRSQNLRWLVIEAGLPLAWGAASIALLCKEQFA